MLSLPPRNDRRALITGITGQDGSYLCELLLGKGYEVHGVIRRSSSFNTARIDHLYQDPHEPDVRLRLVYGDLTDASSINHILKTVRPNEIYNLAAQSHVRVSFDIPEYTAEVTGVGAVRVLESMRELQLTAKFFQASSSEMFGEAAESPQRDTTPLNPCSPYAAAKAFAYFATRNFREAYNMFAVNGIMFNHESPRRGETFVTRKITRGLANIAQGLEDCLYMGNMDALRDWGHTRDYVRMQWLMLQQDQPEDFVIASGEQHSVRDFIRMAARELGITLEFDGTGTGERGTVASVSGGKAPAITPGDVIVSVDPTYFRPTEVESLLGDAGRARAMLGWTPEITLEQMVREMVAHDLEQARRHAVLKRNGYQVTVAKES